MPAVIRIVVGAVGAIALARFLFLESRRVNAELHPERYGGVAARERGGHSGRLRRDANGVYRPE